MRFNSGWINFLTIGAALVNLNRRYISCTWWGRQSWTLLVTRI